VTKVQLAFKAFDCHELLCHAVASESGLYRAAGLDVRLIDSTFVPDHELAGPTFHTACGAALAGFLQGRALHAVFVACSRPMFWLYARPGIAALAELEGARIASFVDQAPPAAFLRGRLENEGVHAELLPCRDDAARLGLLRSGSVEAALISSAYLPHQLEAENLRPLVFIGDTLRLPSTGLAVADELIVNAPELIAAMVGVYRQASERVFRDDRLLKTVLEKTFSMTAVNSGEAVRTVRSCYERSGRCDATTLQKAVDDMARMLGVARRSAVEFYDFRFLDQAN
jgi:hypothetical protein